MSVFREWVEFLRSPRPEMPPTQQQSDLISPERVKEIMGMSMLELERELIMPKTVAKFKMGDGVKPTRLEDAPGRPLELRAPMDVKLTRGSKGRVKLGITFDVPVLVVSFLEETQTETFAPNQEISCQLSALKENVLLGRGEVVAHVYVLGASDVEIKAA